MARFRIHESNIERLRKKITRIRNKCEKYGCDFRYEEIGEVFENYEDEYGETFTTRYIEVEAEGTAVVNGWRFVASVEHTGNGNIIRKNSDDVDIPTRYYEGEPICEHCNSKRRRKDTYIVYNDDTEEFKMVGSSCLADFTGGLSAEAVAQYIALFDTLIEGDAPTPGFHSHPYYHIEDVLLHAKKFVNDLGYRSSAYSDEYSDSTKDIVIESFLVANGGGDKFLREKLKKHFDKYPEAYDTEANKQFVADAIEYIKSIEDEGNNDYIHNLKVIVNSEFVDFRNFGYAVSIIPFYQRHLNNIAYERRVKAQAEEEARNSEFVGNEKDRVTINNPVVTYITGWETMYGYTQRYKIVDESGNVFMWDSSTGIDDEKDISNIVGTVKKHDEFRGVKQTWLTRCRVRYA